MKRRKQFVTPKVVQVAEVCLEKDLLGKSVEDTMKIVSMGQEIVDHNIGEGVDGGYVVEEDWY